MRKVYLDHAATTPVDPQVADAMVAVISDTFGNPSSIHGFGRAARKAMEEARVRVAALIDASPSEIIFTSGGTEADNLAIRGVARAHRDRGNRIITSQAEHHAVLHTCEELEKEGFEVVYLPVDGEGRVRPDQVEAAITDRTILCTVMLGNNEVGTIHPIAAIAAACRRRGVLVHTDAVQAVGQIPVDVQQLGVDLLSMSSHKIYGPKGVGALYVRRRTKILPVQFGGGHERKLRAGTENVPGIVGFGKAAELAAGRLTERVEHLRRVRDRLMEGLLAIPGVRLNGAREERLPNNLNVSVEGVEGESLLLALDMKGIAVSSGSACTSGSLEPSHVLRAMGVPTDAAHGALRFTAGAGTTDEDVDYVLEVVPAVVERLRRLSPTPA